MNLDRREMRVLATEPQRALTPTVYGPDGWRSTFKCARKHAFLPQRRLRKRVCLRKGP